VDDILRGVREALNSRTELASRGRTRAAAATWSNTARATAAVYDEVLA